MSQSKSTLQAVTSIWNDLSEETRRQELSHWRGVGMWSDDEKWLLIGKSSLKKLKKLNAYLGKTDDSLKNMTVLEWGTGGGSNAIAFSKVAQKYYGVDISKKNLDEVVRQCKKENIKDYFVPIPLTGEPKSILNDVKFKIDFFLSTAVFQHFPSKEYGVNVLKTVAQICKQNAFCIIQIRFDNGNPKFSAIKDITDYQDKYLTATSYELSEFWNIAEKLNFEPHFVAGISSKTNYATFYMTYLG